MDFLSSNTFTFEKNADTTRRRLIRHYTTYPLLKSEDLFKFLHQSTFGCEHMVSSQDTAIRYIKEEAVRSLLGTSPLVEPLDGSYSRVHLSILEKGLTPETLGRLFYLSAACEKKDVSRLEEKLSEATRLVHEGQLPLDKNEYQTKLSNWKNAEYRALHHSDAFREAYRPAYRVIFNEFVRLLPLLVALDGCLAEMETVHLSLLSCNETERQELVVLLEKIYGHKITVSPANDTPCDLSFDVSAL